MATTIEKAVSTGKGLPKKTFKITGNDIPANKDESETKRLMKSVTRKMRSDKQVATGKIQITIPNKVATPLPPLNPAKTGKI